MRPRAGPRAGHGPSWKRIAAELGYVGSRVHHGETADELAPWVVQLRWRARSRSAVSLRSSIWVKHDDTWRLRFEQQTPTVR